MKFEQAIYFVIGFILGGIILWYLLTVFGINLAAEVSAIVVIVGISSIIASALHGKGLVNRNYEEEKIRFGMSGRIVKKGSFHNFSYKRELRLDNISYHRKTFREEQLEKDKHLVSSYQRKNYRSDY